MRYTESEDFIEKRNASLEALPTVLTPAEVMDILGIGKNTVSALLNSRQLKGFRVGRSWRITDTALHEYMAW